MDLRIKFYFFPGFLENKTNGNYIYINSNSNNNKNNNNNNNVNIRKNSAKK